MRAWATSVHARLRGTGACAARGSSCGLDSSWTRPGLAPKGAPSGASAASKARRNPRHGVRAPGQPVCTRAACAASGSSSGLAPKGVPSVASVASAASEARRNPKARVRAPRGTGPSTHTCYAAARTLWSSSELGRARATVGARALVEHGPWSVRTQWSSADLGRCAHLGRYSSTARQPPAAPPRQHPAQAPLGHRPWSYPGTVAFNERRGWSAVILATRCWCDPARREGFALGVAGLPLERSAPWRAHGDGAPTDIVW